MAPCIAMVIVWNTLAKGDDDLCVVIVAVNSIIQLFLYSPLAYFYTVIISATPSQTQVSFILVIENVLLFLGIPFFAGFITRTIFRRYLNKKKWYDENFLGFVSHFSLIGLLFTIFVMFALQGPQMIHKIGQVLRIIVPLLLYFTITWISSLFIARKIGYTFPVAITLSFTTASNNYELAMAVAIAVNVVFILL